MDTAARVDELLEVLAHAFACLETAEPDELAVIAFDLAVYRAELARLAEPIERARQTLDALEVGLHRARSTN